MMFFFLPSEGVLRAIPPAVRMCPCTLKLDEGKSKHVGLAQQHKFWPSILLEQFAESGKGLYHTH